MRLHAGLSVLIAVAGLACSSPTAPDGAVDTQLVLVPGEIVPIAGAGSSIRFQRVVEDSRCPGDALCIHAGDAVVRLDIIGARSVEATYDLHTSNPQPAQHEDLQIALVTLSPYPFSSLPPIRPGDYRATVHVTGTD
jgi:hypothetical protein